jgi:hypothetical protein
MFIVDIKDRMFVFLDSYYSKDDEYQEHVRDLLISHVQVNWDRYIQNEKDEVPMDMRLINMSLCILQYLNKAPIICKCSNFPFYAFVLKHSFF